MLRLACLVIAVVIALPATANANGRPPASVNVQFRPGAPRELFAAVTWGLLVSNDDGATWRWTCEDAIGYGTAVNYDPDYAVTQAGALLATTFKGLRITTDGCAWNETPLGESFVSTVTVGGDGAVWVGLSQSAIPGDGRILKSIDGGMTFQPLGSTGHDGGDAWWESLEIAPGDPRRAYLAGYVTSPDGKREMLLLRSRADGRNWDRLSTALFAVTNRSALQIAAVSPDDPDFLFARVTDRPGPPMADAIYRSDDAGDTWTLAKEFDFVAPGVIIRKGAASADKAEVVIGTSKSGTWRSTDGGVTFTEVKPSLQVTCLRERDDGTVFACANNLAPDFMALAQSKDLASWTPALQFKNVTGPVACSAGTVQRDTCQGRLWCGVKAQLGILSEEITCPSGAPDAGTTPPPRGGCDCDAGGAAGGIVGLAFLALRRRRRRESP